MITLFRRIRQRFIESGSVTKYLLYAIGEILLVVIGILIALQVNNWNEERLQQREEIEVLSNVKSDFQQGIDEMVYLNGIRKRMTESIDRLITEREMILSEFEPKQIDSLLAVLTNTPTYNNQSGSLEVLLNSGRINLVSDDTLRNLLISWPGAVEDMIEGELDQEELDRDHYRPLLRKHISMNNMFRHFSLEGIPDEVTQKFQRQSGVQVDHAAFLRDPLFENINVNRELLLLIASVETDELIDLANEIIQRIDQHVSD